MDPLGRDAAAEQVSFRIFSNVAESVDIAIELAQIKVCRKKRALMRERPSKGFASVNSPRITVRAPRFFAARTTCRSKACV